MLILRYAARELLRHPSRSLFAVAGVAVACAMLLDMLMLSSGLGTSFRSLLAGEGYSLRVAPAGSLPFDTDATIADAAEVRAGLAAHPAVTGVAPVLGANFLEGPDGGARVFALGIDPEEQGFLTLVDGRLPTAADEAVVGMPLRDEGVGPGDTLLLAPAGGLGRVAAAPPRRFRVVGTGRFHYAPAGERSVALPIRTVAEVAGRPDRASLMMVRLADGASPDAVAEQLRRDGLALEIASVGELVERAERRLSYFRQLALILGTVSLVVTSLLIGTIMAVSINDRYGTIAALRAIGVSRGSILTALAVESLLLCTAAAAIGLVLGLFTADRLEAILADFPGLPRAIRFFVLEPRQAVQAGIALLLAGVGAALVPAWRVTHLPIAATLHGEEP
ncbi:MAG: ABC transporter permease [Gemmatimonadota bacterium]|nr:ABC transporter permease [Gemmatimonadota bacterium]